MSDLLERKFAPIGDGRIAFALSSEEYAAVSAGLPRLEPYEYKGVSLWSHPHDFDGVRELQGQGLNPPSPLVFDDWKYPGPYTPYEHQRVTADFILRYQRSMVLNGLGSGKTASCIFAIEYMRAKGEISGPVLITCPKSCVRKVWSDEIWRLTNNNRVAELVQPTQKQLDAARSCDYIIVNHDGIKLARTHEMLKQVGLSMIVADEVTAFKGSQGKASARYKVLAELSEGIRFVGLTGTPTPNGPADGFRLSKLVGNTDAPRTFTQWRLSTEYQPGYHKHAWKPKQGWEGKVYNWLQPAIRFSTEDCIDLPPLVTMNRDCGLTSQQKQMITRLKNEYQLMDQQGIKIDASNAGVMISKALQICTGAVRAQDEDDTVIVEVDAKSRYDVLCETIDTSASKVIVFAPFTAALNGVVSYLNERYGDGFAALVDGSVSDGKRTAAFTSFQEQEHGVQVLVAHPATMAHGLTLTAADTIVWFAPPFSSELYSQGNGRIARPGQKRSMRIVHLGGHTIEWKLYEKLEKRQMEENQLLDMCREVFL